MGVNRWGIHSRTSRNPREESPPGFNVAGPSNLRPVTRASSTPEPKTLDQRPRVSAACAAIHGSQARHSRPLPTHRSPRGPAHSLLRPANPFRIRWATWISTTSAKRHAPSGRTGIIHRLTCQTDGSCRILRTALMQRRLLSPRLDVAFRLTFLCQSGRRDEVRSR